MAILRSGLALFVSFTAVAIASGWGLMLLTSNGGFDPGEEYLPLILQISAVTFATSIVLMVLAWRGRRQPLGDGVLSINLVVIGYGLAQLVSFAASGPSPYPDSMPAFYLLLVVGVHLMFLVPAYLVTYLALHRTPLLSGLVPPPKSKGPAEASPS